MIDSRPASPIFGLDAPGAREHYCSPMSPPLIGGLHAQRTQKARDLAGARDAAVDVLGRAGRRDSP
jgi:hypothetical protein